MLGGRIPYLEYGYTAEPWPEQVASLERAAGPGVELLLPGHGPPETDVEPRIASALGAVRAAPERVLGVLGEEPKTAYGATAAVLGPETTFYRRHAALSGAFCVLVRLVAEGVVQAWSDDDGVRWYAAGAS